MNVFEIFQTEGNIEQALFAGIIQYQNYWLSFREIIDNLFVTLQFNKHITLELWGNIYSHSEQLVPVVIDYYRSKFDQILHSNYIPDVKQILSKRDYDKSIKAFQYIANLHHAHKEFLSVLSQNPKAMLEEPRHRNQPKLVEALTSKLKVTLIEKIDFHTVIEEYFRLEFLKHCRSVVTDTKRDFEHQTLELIRKKSSEIDSKFDKALNKKALKFLIDIDLYDRMLVIVSNISSIDLHEYIKGCESCIDQNTQFLRKCQIYFENFHHSFEMMIEECLTETLPLDVKTEYIEKLKRSQQKYRNNIYFFFAKLCIRKIIDIVLSFPESYQLVLELKKAIDKTGMLNDLADTLNEAIGKRLLIPGVITQNILNQYINMLKILQILDPNGVIFDKITTPIRSYLLKRNDTLRCIISHLTEDVENYSKLIKEVVKIPSKEHFDDMSSDQDEQAAEKWQVLPLLHKKSQIRVKYQEIDLVTVLVNLYGSQEAFISEYQNMLAEKLMSAKEFSIDEEIKNLELLKLRFGESALQTCNIIVKDVKDSKRTDNLIHKQPKTVASALLNPENLHCLAVSKGYWPINYEASSNYNVPTSLKPVFDDYATKFMKTKAMRKIQWHYNLGFVNLALSFDNGEFKFKCLPIHAILISYFDEDRLKAAGESGVSIETLSKELNLPPNVIKQRMSFWIHKEVIRESKTFTKGLRRMNSFENENESVSYHPVKVYNGKTTAEDDILYDETDQMIMKESTSLEMHLAHVVEGLILSILNTNGPKSAEKIHLLLKTVYKNDLNYNFGEAQTKQILKKMMSRKKVAFNGETYSAIVEL